MKFWPFEKRESSYTDAVIQAFLHNAEGKSLALPSATAALEACSGLTGRGFAAAEVSGAFLHHLVLDSINLGNGGPVTNQNRPDCFSHRHIVGQSSADTCADPRR